MADPTPAFFTPPYSGGTEGDPEPVTVQPMNDTSPMTDQPVPAATRWTVTEALIDAVRRYGIESPSLPYEVERVVAALAPAPTAPADLGQQIAMTSRYGERIVREGLARRAALASPSEEPGLDANLMGRAVHAVFHHGFHGGGQDDADGDIGHALIAEYARLAKEPGS